MFAGLVQEVGTIVKLSRLEGGMKLTIEAARSTEDLHVGDSVSVSGICLTVTSVGPPTFVVQAVEETILRTTLQRWRVGDRVNIEPALRPSDRLGGHIVTGHVDGIGIVRSRLAHKNSFMISIEFPVAFDHLVVVKGSVAIDGVSLTVANLVDSRMFISVIPYTAAVTTLGYRSVGDAVNVEFDILGKYIEKYLENSMRRGQKFINEDRLKELGY